MLEGLLFLILWTLLPTLWNLMLKGAGVNLRRISIPGIFMLSMGLFQYIGFPLAFFQLENISANYIGGGNATVWTVFAYTSLTFTFLIIGFITAARTTINSGPDLENRFSLNGFVPASQVERMYLIALLVISVSVLVSYSSIIGFDNIALFAVLGFVETEIGATKLRSLMGTEFSGKYHWYSYFMRDLLSLVAFSIYADYLLTKRTRLKAFIIIAIFCVSAFSFLMATEKGPFLWLIIGFFIVRLIVVSNSYVNRKALFGGLLALIPLGLYIFYSFIEVDDFGVALEAFISRLFVAQMQSFFHAVEIVPSQIDYLFGRTISNPGGILPYTPYDFSAEMTYRYGFQLNSAEVAVTTLPLMFSAEAYVNFGVLGVVVSSAALGYFFYKVNIFFVSLTAQPLVVGTFVWVMLHFKDLSMTGLGSLIVDHQLWTTAVILAVGLLLTGQRRVKNRYTV
jgi:hypothetical protein